MTHKIVSAVVGLILAFFVVAALLFAWAMEARVQSAAAQMPGMGVPHPVTGSGAKCSDCHNARENTVPVTHRNFAKTDCTSCHAPMNVIAVPHSVTMGDARCPLCHGDPAQDLGMPKTHLQRGYERCSFCHEVSPPMESKQPRPAGESKKAKPEITHPTTGAFANCLYCHRIGGEPPMPTSHRAFSGETCTWCHRPAASATSSTTVSGP